MSLKAFDLCLNLSFFFPSIEKSITLSHSSAIQRFHEELNELADSDQLVNNWPAVERAIEVTMQVKQIDRTIHEK